MLARVCVRGKKPSFIVTGNVIGAAILELSMYIFQNAKINLSYDPAIQLLGICPKDLTSYSTDTCSSGFIAALVTIEGNGNNNLSVLHRWIENETMVQLYDLMLLIWKEK